jgi:hypothetical protein
MKRDMGLIRKILFALEARDVTARPEPVELPGHDALEIRYHLALMVEARLIEAIDLGSNKELISFYVPTRITWAGHDFIDAARSDTVWKRVTNKLAAVGGTVSLELLKKLLTDTAAGVIAGSP